MAKFTFMDLHICPTLHGNVPPRVIAQNTGMTWEEATKIGPDLVFRAIISGQAHVRTDLKPVAYRPPSEAYLKRKKIYNRAYNQKRRAELIAKGLTSNGTPRIRSYKTKRL